MVKISSILDNFFIGDYVTVEGDLNEVYEVKDIIDPNLEDESYLLALKGLRKGKNVRVRHYEAKKLGSRQIELLKKVLNKTDT